MTLYGLWIFSLVYFLAVATPGPGVAAIIARSLAEGTRGAVAFIAGFLVGDLIWFSLAATGLAALAQTAYTLFLVVKYVGAAYLLYLAYRMWRAKPQIATEDAQMPQAERSSRLFFGSLALTLANPKTMIFFLALLPTVVELTRLDLAGFMEITATICVVLPLVLGGYTLLAANARKIFKSERAVKRINRASGVAMAGAAVAVVVKN
jgi:threonine/homoserine/homoserine lactone efflux protein